MSERRFIYLLWVGFFISIYDSKETGKEIEMTNEFFKIVVERRVNTCKGVLIEKAKEYARGDRLSNFKKASGAMSCTPEKALIGMLMKHIISIVDMVDDIDKEQLASRAVWDEKLGDAINYLILLDGLITERIDDKKDIK